MLPMVDNAPATAFKAPAPAATTVAGSRIVEGAHVNVTYGNKEPNF